LETITKTTAIVMISGLLMAAPACGDEQVANQTFGRKDADTRCFQPHQECMRRPPDTFTEEVEDALRAGEPVPAKTLLSPPAAVTAPAPQVQSGTTPSTPAPRLVDTKT
jgi:hypothetical protein